MVIPKMYKLIMLLQLLDFGSTYQKCLEGISIKDAIECCRVITSMDTNELHSDVECNQIADKVNPKNRISRYLSCYFRKNDILKSDGKTFDDAKLLKIFEVKAGEYYPQLEDAFIKSINYCKGFLLDTTKTWNNLWSQLPYDPIIMEMMICVPFSVTQNCPSSIRVQTVLCDEIEDKIENCKMDKPVFN